MRSIALVVVLTSAGVWAQENGRDLRDSRENRLVNVRQLTFGGENAEGYFDRKGNRLIYQSTRGPWPCDQIFVLDLISGESRRVSTGKGRTTCSYFFPDGERILYSSTHHRDVACPAPPQWQGGYIWSLEAYDIFMARADGSDLQPLTDRESYDAEATFHPDGSRIVFTSLREGDLDIYSMAADGSDVRRLTDSVGYDGGPFYSEDGTKICYRAYHPEAPQEIERYRELLGRNLVEPFRLDIFVMNADGSGRVRLTDNAAANFCPFFHPDGQRVIFSSNMDDPTGREFDLYMIGIDGTGLERITYSADFDGFPMFSPDGKYLTFSSNRNGRRPHETNLFIAEWVERPEE